MTNPLSPLETYLFDLRGFIVLEGALGADAVQALNATLDAFPSTRAGEWIGWVYTHSFGGRDGTNYQQIYEAGPAFEALIDHPSWIDKVKALVGGEGTFDWNHGPLFIDENFANIRGPGEAIGLHSGGHTGTKRTQFQCQNGKFHCGQVNVLMALNDIGPGDGATMVIPGSHKANFPHPDFEKYKMKADAMTSLNDVEGAIEVHLRAGDALLFVDAISHGSAERKNPGQRRIAVYRYGPSWGFFRHAFRPSPELLQRLTPERRSIVWPHEHKLAPPHARTE